MASYQRSTARCPIPLLLVAFGALALLIPMSAYAQDLDSQLLDAAKSGQTDKVQALLQSGARVNEKDNEGRTPLMFASAYGHSSIVQVLLDAGADVNAKANNGSTALVGASWNGHTDTVQVLLANGAKVNEKNRDGVTALMGSAVGGHISTVKTLLDAGDCATLSDTVTMGNKKHLNC